jgi:hypothetical protein
LNALSGKTPTLVSGPFLFICNSFRVSPRYHQNSQPRFVLAAPARLRAFPDYGCGGKAETTLVPAMIPEGLLGIFCALVLMHLITKKMYLYMCGVTNAATTPHSLGKCRKCRFAAMSLVTKSNLMRIVRVTRTLSPATRGNAFQHISAESCPQELLAHRRGDLTRIVRVTRTLPPRAARAFSLLV